MESEFLKSLVVIFGVSALVVFLFHRIKIPSLVGFLAAGVLIGPHGIGIIEDAHAIESMAEIGVILLLFTIGLEFSMIRLLRMKKAVIGGGGIQVLLTIGLSAVVAYPATGNINRSVFFGFLVALSSTAIVLKMLAEKGETDTPHGRVMTGALIFQDLCVVPLMLLTPALSGENINVPDVAMKMVMAALIVSAALLSAKWVVPGILHQVVRTRSRELFITSIILLCLGIALLTSRFGLSLALGAFLAGLIISESEYAHQATSDILPFKDSFIGLFFVSIGMLMDLSYVFDHFLTIISAVALIFALKTVSGMFAALATGSPLRTSVHAGLGLAQIGEFSFVLAVAGKASGLITGEFYQVFLSSSIVTMIMTPFVLEGAPSLTGWLTSGRVMSRFERIKNIPDEEVFPAKRQGHVIIIGFGLNGKNLARVLREAEIPYVVLEMNSDTVRAMKQKGEPIYYGDGTGREILRKLGIHKAMLLVIAISDPASTRRIVAAARHENPGLYIIVRTRYVAETDDLMALGADEVIPEEFETSVEIFSRVLNRYNFPREVILDMAERIRSGSYTALRSVKFSGRRLFKKYDLPEIEIDGFKIPGGSSLAGKSIGGLQVRKNTGVTIIAVRRGTQVHTNPGSEFFFDTGDIILFTGERKSMDAALRYFREER